MAASDWLISRHNWVRCSCRVAQSCQACCKTQTLFTEAAALRTRGKVRGGGKGGEREETVLLNVDRAASRKPWEGRRLPISK